MTSLVPDIAATGSHTDGRERVEGLKMDDKEMDILKDLPSYNSSNFSRLLSPGSTATGTAAAKVNLVCVVWKLVEQNPSNNRT